MLTISIHFEQYRLDCRAMSEPAPVSDIGSAEVGTSDQQEPKRRRRSGWDVQVPPSASTSVEPNAEYLQQQAQQALLAQQLALQKAQQAIALQAIQKTLASTLGGINANLPKPGCRVYIG